MKVLLVAPAWVGDMVMAHSLVQVLLTRHADVEIDVVAPAATVPLAERMPGVATRALLEIGHGELALGRRRALGRALAGDGYDQAIVLPNTFKSALVPWWAGIPLRTGWQGESRFAVLNDRRRLDADRYPLMIERFMALGLPAGADLPTPYPTPRLSVDEANRQRLQEELELDTDGGVLALCPGAEFGPAKRWPAAHYAAVARDAAAGGRRVWLFGSPGERAACAGIAALAPDAINLAGRTRLLDAVDLLSLAEVVVSNDSGLMHVAGAVGTRVVAVFGSTSPAFTPPLGAAAQVVRVDVPCGPCFQRSCPLGHRRCLEELGPERVIGLL
ncbi:MAG: lipopolysaccharide heptosyltransferase II [Pseudomonadales bacterium]